MNTHADKIQENKSQSVSNETSQKQGGDKSTFQFVDNRPEAIAQRKLQEIANTSKQVSQLRAFQEMPNNSSQAQKTAQLQSMADNHSTQQQQPIQKKENNTGLPDDLKTGMENLSGTSLGDVKVHRNSDKPAQLQAHAYAQGTDIHLGPGQEKHLPHEAWHVVQQKQGRVKPIMQMKGKVIINDDIGLEKEADVMGTKALEMRRDGIADESNKNVADNINLNQFQPIVQSKKNSISDTDNSTIQLKRERRGAVVESTLKPEEIEYLQKFRDVENILKFNFAGSGEKAWKTHKEKYAKPGKEQMGNAEHQSGGKKYGKEKKTLNKNKTIFEYAGPISKLFGKKGLKDSGKNSTQANLEDAQREFNGYMMKYLEARTHLANCNDVLLDGINGLATIPEEKELNLGMPLKKVQIAIKGFSRGAAAASVFSNWINSSAYKDNVDINLVLIDPVHGTGMIAKGLMPGEQDVSAIHDQAAPDTTGTTYLMPIKSGHSSNYFTPQNIRGYQRLIIGFGSGIKHSFGLGEKEESTLKYLGKPVKGMQLSTLPKGLFVVDAADMNIIKVPNMKIWKSHFEDLVLGKANKQEGRDDVIKEALVALNEYL